MTVPAASTPDELLARVAALEERWTKASDLADEIREGFNRPVEMIGEATRLLSNLVQKVERLLSELSL